MMLTRIAAVDALMPLAAEWVSQNLEQESYVGTEFCKNKNTKLEVMVPLISNI